MAINLFFLNQLEYRHQFNSACFSGRPSVHPAARIMIMRREPRLEVQVQIHSENQINFAFLLLTLGLRKPINLRSKFCESSQS